MSDAEYIQGLQVDGSKIQELGRNKYGASFDADAQFVVNGIVRRTGLTPQHAAAALVETIREGAFPEDVVNSMARNENQIDSFVTAQGPMPRLKVASDIESNSASYGQRGTSSAASSWRQRENGRLGDAQWNRSGGDELTDAEWNRQFSERRGLAVRTRGDHGTVRRLAK